MGPMMWLTFGIFLIGMGYRVFGLVKLTAKRQRLIPPGVYPNAGSIPIEKERTSLRERFFHFRRSLMARQPVTLLVSIVFHLLLISVPVFLTAHNILMDAAWGVRAVSLDEQTTDLLTLLFLGCCLFFLIRRIWVGNVRSISTFGDFAILFFAAMPFLTGAMAYHQIFDYQILIILHILSGQFMLMAIPFTKLVHMAVFFFNRWAARPVMFKKNDLITKEFT